MTLYERIKPSCLEALNAEKEKYPKIHAEVVEALKSHEFYLEMKYGNVLDLESLTGCSVHTMFNLPPLVTQ